MATHLRGVLPTGAAAPLVGIVLVNADGTTVHPQPTLYQDQGLSRPTGGDSGSILVADAEGAFHCWAPDPPDGTVYVAETTVGNASKVLQLTAGSTPPTAPPAWH